MHSLFFKGVLKRWLYLEPLRNTVLTNKNSLPVSCFWRFWMIWHRNHATFISWKYLLRFSHLKKWQFVFSCPILMYWSIVPSMWFWSVSWSTNCPVYFSIFLVDQNKIVQSQRLDKKIWTVSDFFLVSLWFFLFTL